MTTPDVSAGTAAGESLATIFLRPFLKLASVQPGERVLDLICGSGEATIEAAARSGPTGEVLALDTRQEALDAVIARARAMGVEPPGASLMDPAKLDQPSAYWDIILCHFGLADLSDAEATLKEAARVLRPVGRLAISAPGERARCPLITIFLDVVGKHLPALQAADRALFRYSEPGRLARLLAEMGFEDAVPERITEWAPFRDIDDYWHTLTTTTRFAAPAAALHAETIAECKTEIERRTRFYRRGAGLELKVEAIILAAVR